MVFNERLKILRKERKMTQDAIAKELEIPLRSYNRLESGGGKTHYDTLIRIADYYEVSLDWLTGRSDVREINRG